MIVLFNYQFRNQEQFVKGGDCWRNILTVYTQKKNLDYVRYIVRALCIKLGDLKMNMCSFVYNYLECKHECGEF